MRKELSISLLLVTLGVLPIGVRPVTAIAETGAAAAGGEASQEGAPDGKKVLWDRLETPDLPKAPDTTKSTDSERKQPDVHESSASSDREQIENLKEEIEGLKQRLTAVEGKVAIQGQIEKSDKTP